MNELFTKELFRFLNFLKRLVLLLYDILILYSYAYIYTWSRACCHLTVELLFHIIL